MFKAALVGFALFFGSEGFNLKHEASTSFHNIRCGY